MDRTSVPPGAPAFEDIQGQRRLLCAALAAAVKEAAPGAQLGSCGTTGTGFYHDFLMTVPFGLDRLPEIEASMRALLARGPVVLSRLTAAEALDLAAGEPLVREELERGSYHDETLVRIGPHDFIASEKPTEAVSPATAFRLEGISGAYWRGDESRPMLTRIAGVAFACARELDEHERAAEREEQGRLMTVRNRDTGREATLDAAEFVGRLAAEVDERALRAVL